MAEVDNHRRGEFHARSVRVHGVEYAYQVWLPPGWNAQQEWPVILSLHGAGERGSDNEAQLRVGLGATLQRQPERWPFIVVFPQCRRSEWWVDGPMKAQALTASDEATAEFSGQLQRRSLTGISMGAYGVWQLAVEHPEMFAAVVPICGGWASRSIGLFDAARAIARVPIWAFHGAEDDVVPVEESREIVELLRSLNAKVQYTEYRGVGHDSRDRAYAEPELSKWMLEQRLQERVEESRRAG